MFVKIISSSDPNYWYSSEIGRILEVDEHMEGTYQCTNNHVYLLDKRDCVKVLPIYFYICKENVDHPFVRIHLKKGHIFSRVATNHYYMYMIPESGTWIDIPHNYITDAEKKYLIKYKTNFVEIT